MARRFSLDFGMRFHYLPQSWINGDAMSGFWADAYNRSQAVRLIEPALQGTTCVGRNPNTGQTVPGTLIGAIAPGRGSTSNGMISPLTDPTVPRSLMKERGLQFGPRVGFAWDVFGNGKTSVRGGVGMFYNRMSHGVVLTDFSVQPPLVDRPTVYFGAMSGLLGASGVLFPANVSGLDRNAKIPMVINYSFSVQRDVGYNTLVDIGYVGSLGRHLLWQRNLNAIGFGTNFLVSSNDATTNRPLPVNFRRPYPGWGNITVREPAGSSNYHSLQASANRRFANKLQFGASYTWSKSFDYNSDDGNAVSALVPVRIWNYGLSSFDRTHVLKLNWLYDLPQWTASPLAARWAVTGWQVSGIYTTASGAPSGVGFSTVTGIDITGSPTDGARINVNANPNLGSGERGFGRWFQTDVFSQPAVGTFGTSARTVIRLPGINNWDLTAYKNFRIKERFSTQVRAEFYNAFNHTQFSGVDTAARFDAQGRQVNTQFGQVTATRPGRRIQLAVRVSF